MNFSSKALFIHGFQSQTCFVAIETAPNLLPLETYGFSLMLSSTVHTLSLCLYIFATSYYGTTDAT